MKVTISSKFYTIPPSLTFFYNWKLREQSWSEIKENKLNFPSSTFEWGWRKLSGRTGASIQCWSSLPAPVSPGSEYKAYLKYKQDRLKEVADSLLCCCLFHSFNSGSARTALADAALPSSMCRTWSSGMGHIPCQHWQSPLAAPSWQQQPQKVPL